MWHSMWKWISKSRFSWLELVPLMWFSGQVGFVQALGIFVGVIVLVTLLYMLGAGFPVLLKQLKKRK